MILAKHKSSSKFNNSKRLTIDFTLIVRWFNLKPVLELFWKNSDNRSDSQLLVIAGECEVLLSKSC